MTAISSQARVTGAPYLAPSKATRISSVDIIRGAVMVLMALDHVRDFVTNRRIRPEDLSRSSAALFATRWITPTSAHLHFRCSPALVSAFG
jgi:uncharacterized membrane protein